MMFAARNGMAIHMRQDTMLRNAARSGVEVEVEASMPIETKSPETRMVPNQVPITAGQSGGPPA